MSYLDLPRVHFAGQFQASPSTINNTPNNYDPTNWTPEKTELYWGPDGDGIFDLIGCTVTAVIPLEDTEIVDPLHEKPVIAAYTKAPPKLVDLDPMQQNVSEIWGMLMQLGDPGGDFVRGVFEPISFNGIWAVAQGVDAPHSSASGSGVYQSTLTNLVWGGGDEGVLATLKSRSPDRLSVKMVVSAHNNFPHNYLFDAGTFQEMANDPYDIPADVIAKLQVLSEYRQMNPGGGSQGTPPGSIPTAVYVNYQLKQLLGEQLAQKWGSKILACTKRKYSHGSTAIPPYEFNYGQIVGSIGPAETSDPIYVVPARTLAPPTKPNPEPAPGQPSLVPDSPCWWAPAKLHAQNEDGTGMLTVDLGNSLPVENPGPTVWPEPLGTLSLAYRSATEPATEVSIISDIDYSDEGGLMMKRAGVVDIPLSKDQFDAVRAAPLVLRGTGESKTLLEENPEGLSARADQFVFRMNPGEQTTPSYPRGDTAIVNIYVRKYGEIAGTEELSMSLAKLSKEDAIGYTINTLGTSGTKGITGHEVSVPQDKLAILNAKAKVVDGVATFDLAGENPGNPRVYVDGQVYFARYSFTSGASGYFQDPNDLVSVQIYEQTEIEGTPTWTNGISTILSQFGRLYPIMGRFELGNYDTVKKYSAAIRGVLAREMADPLHMPATRDLSKSRRKIVLDWIDAGMPRA